MSQREDPRALDDAALLVEIGAWWRSVRRLPEVTSRLSPAFAELLDEAERRDRRCICPHKPPVAHGTFCPAGRPPR